MYQDDVQIELGIAIVTPDGILFRNLYYTHAAMIKYKWFERAGVEGPWQIPVLYQTSDLQHIVLFDMHSLEVATTVEEREIIADEVLQVYYRTINELKKLYFN